MTAGRGSLITGVVLILAGIVLFWASTRKTLSATARGFLEGQGTLAVPAGLAAIAYGAGKEAKSQQRRKAHAKQVKNERPGRPPAGPEKPKDGDPKR